MSDEELAFFVRYFDATEKWHAVVKAQPATAGVFASERARDNFFRRIITAERKKWKRPSKCIFPGCSAHSIGRSHAIPKAKGIQTVSEDGHVITPRVRDGVGLQMCRVGVREASTFPGFCTEHELEFEPFERSGVFTDVRDWTLQFYRTVCWELRILEHARERISRIAAAYESVLCAHGSGVLSEQLNIQATITAARLIDWRQSVFQDEYERLGELLAKYKQDFFEPLLAELSGQGVPEMEIIVLTVEQFLPVCLAGKGNFHWLMDDGPLCVDVFLQVLPGENETRLALLGPPNRDQLVRGYVGHFMRTHGALRMVEAWMLNGTDHWFLRPSAWAALSPEQQDAVRIELRDTVQSIGEPAEHPIFLEHHRALMQG